MEEKGGRPDETPHSVSVNWVVVGKSERREGFLGEGVIGCSKTKEKRTGIVNKTKANEGNTEATDPCSSTWEERNGRFLRVCVLCAWW